MIVALMLAPKRGAELRDEIAERARRADGRTKESVSQLS
jgi:gas vesicle protein